MEDSDIICVGFGATALSLAVALSERDSDTKILFLERQPKSAWKPLARLPGHSTMQTSFMSDLVTFENPRSKFTFLKFLHSRNLLVNFTNVGRTKPARELFAQYLSWCAEHFEKSVRYSTEVAGVDAVCNDSNQVDHWRVFARNSMTGQRSIIRAKRVVVAVGQEPKIPALLSVPTVASSVVHSSECLDTLDGILKNTSEASNIAIIGDGQQAAELFEYVHSLRTQDRVTMFLEHTSLTSTLENPNKTREFTSNSFPSELRANIKSSNTTSHASDRQPIADDLLYKLNETQYTQSVKQSDSTHWQYQIYTSQRLACAARTPDGRICLAFTDTSKNTTTTFPTTFDLIIAATGYDTSNQTRLISSLARQQLLEDHKGNVTVDSNYRVNLRRKTFRGGRALWMTGSLGDQSEEKVMPILAERGRRLVDSLMAVKALEKSQNEEQDKENEVLARL